MICPEVLHEDIIVVKGRLVLVQPDSKIQRPENCKTVAGSTGEKVGKKSRHVIYYNNYCTF